MNTERLIKIVTMELAADQIKLEDELERTINQDLEINTKVSMIKSLLTRITSNDASLAKFTSMVSNTNNNPN